MSQLLIRGNKIAKTYVLPAEKIHAVRELDLEIRSGEFITLMGPSGSGKTTLLDILGCLDTISQGRLEVLGADVSHARENALVKIRRSTFGFVFQDFLLIPTLTALENVELALFFSGLSSQHRPNAMAWLDKVGLGKRLHHLPKELSGGEKQRVAIARALVTSPKILFADEPTGNLDTKSGVQVFDILKSLNKEKGLTIVVTTHNPQLGSQGSRVLYMKDGAFVTQEQSSLFVRNS